MALDQGDERSVEGSERPLAPDALLRDELWRRQPLMAALNLALGMLVLAPLLTAVPPVQAASWFLALALTQAARLTGWARARRWSAEVRDRRLPPRHFTIISALSGLAWGGLALVAHDPTAPVGMLVPFVLAGMVAGSISVLAAHPPAFGAFILGIASPYLLSLLLWPPPLALWLALIVVLYVAGMGLVGRHLHRGQRRAAALYDHNRQLVEALGAARDELEGRVVQRTADLEQANAVLAEEVRRRRHSEQREREIGLQDPLTGLPNRLILGDRLTIATRRAARTGALVALAIVDVDGFKGVNDTLGHLAGDRLLRLLAARLRTVLRGSDTLARFGGDEFVAIFTDVAGEADALRAAERLVEATSAPFDVGDHARNVSVSVGVAVYPKHGSDIDELLGGADVALYQAKLHGRGRAEMLGPELIESFRARRRALAEMRARVDAADIALAYRPRARLGDGRLVGVAVQLAPATLVSAGTLSRGIVELARAGGFLGEVEDAYVQRAVAEFAARAGAELTLALTLTAETLARPRVAGRLLEQIAAGGLAPGRVEIGVDERAWRAPLPQGLRETYGELRGAGVRLAVDGFGDDDAALAVLADAPLDVVRVAEGIGGEDAELSAAVRTVVLDLARRRGLQVVVRGRPHRWAAGDARRSGDGLVVETPAALDDDGLEAWLAAAGFADRRQDRAG